MNKVLKTLLIVITVIVSVHLLSVFILYNFPYDALVNRVDVELRKYGITFTADEVRYRYPLSVVLQDIEIAQKKEGVALSADTLRIRLRLFLFGDHKTLEVRGTGLAVKSGFIDGSGGYLQISAQLNLISMLRSNPLSQVESVIFQTGGMDVARVFFSGFELSDMELKQVLFELAGDENRFSVTRGYVKSDVIESKLTGSLDENSIDVIVSVSLTQTFYNRYKDLKGFVDSFFKNGKLRMRIQGDWASPRVEFL